MLPHIYNILFAHNGHRFRTFNALNLWSNTLLFMMKLQKYWVICENSSLHFIVRWFFRVTYSFHMPYDCNGNMKMNFKARRQLNIFFNWIKEEQLKAWHKAYTLKVCKAIIGSQRFWWWILPQIKKQSKQHQRGCHTSCVTTASRTIIVAAPSLS